MGEINLLARRKPARGGGGTIKILSPKKKKQQLENEEGGTNQSKGKVIVGKGRKRQTVLRVSGGEQEKSVWKGGRRRDNIHCGRPKERERLTVRRAIGVAEREKSA